MAMPWIVINGAITFSPSHGVYVDKAVLDWTPEQTHSAIKLAYEHMHDHYLVEACCGATGPLASYGILPYEEYLELVGKIEREDKIQIAARKAKNEHVKTRRKEFSRIRSDLYLAMIDAGVPHECYHVDCEEVDDLTIDHIVPLSKGGTDELKNLQFACRSHNSRKGDRCEG